MSSLLLLIAVAVLVALNGFFVAAEFALVRARREKVEAAEREGKRGARLALHQIEKIDEYLSACQLGITMASLGIGFLGEPAIARLLEGLLGDAVPHWVSATISIGTAYLIVTAAHITVGEQVPKIYAITHAEGTARWTAPGLQLFRVASRPLIWALNTTSNWMLRLVGVNAQAEFEEETRSEDLKMLIARGMQGGTLDPGEAVMLSGVFHLHEQEARQVMTPIPAVVTVDCSDTAKTALERCIDSGHTRLVVTEGGNTDHIRGMVHANSLARLFLEEGADAPIEPIVKDVLVIPETKPLDDLLADLQRERVSMAVVVDEYGRTVGLTSVEDIIEEIVGEITDETDPQRGAVRRLANGDWYVRGHVPITDLDDYGIHFETDSDAFNSVGGFVFSELGRLPKRGDIVRSDGYSLRVESVRENRIEAVRIRDHEPKRREGGGEGGGGSVPARPEAGNGSDGFAREIPRERESDEGRESVRDRG